MVAAAAAAPPAAAADAEWERVESLAEMLATPKSATRAQGDNGERRAYAPSALGTAAWSAAGTIAG